MSDFILGGRLPFYILGVVALALVFVPTLTPMVCLVGLSLLLLRGRGRRNPPWVDGAAMGACVLGLVIALSPALLQMMV